MLLQFTVSRYDADACLWCRREKSSGWSLSYHLEFEHLYTCHCDATQERKDEQTEIKVEKQSEKQAEGQTKTYFQTFQQYKDHLVVCKVCYLFLLPFFTLIIVITVVYDIPEVPKHSLQKAIFGVQKISVGQISVRA